MRFIWFRLLSSDPESGTENHSLNLGRNYHSLNLESILPGPRLFKTGRILELTKSFWIHESTRNQELSSFSFKNTPPSPLDWSPRDREGVSSEEEDKYCNTHTHTKSTYSLLISNTRRVRAFVLSYRPHVLDGTGVHPSTRTAPVQ